MDVITKPRHWHEMELRSTEELMRIWESRELDIWSEESLISTEQVLYARNIINLSEKATSIAWYANIEEQVLDEFTVRQIKDKNISYIWTVKLLNYKANFHCLVTGEEFTINREESYAEFRFQKSGFLMMNESNAALVQGRLLDFGEYKRNLFSWMAELPRKDLKKRLGIVMLIAGSISLFLSTVIYPIFGSLLILLGLINLLLPGISLFVLNGLTLFSIGAINLLESINIYTITKTYPLLISTFWATIGVWLIFWGFSEIKGFWKYVKNDQ